MPFSAYLATIFRIHMHEAMNAKDPETSKERWQRIEEMVSEATDIPPLIMADILLESERTDLAISVIKTDNSYETKIRFLIDL